MELRHLRYFVAVAEEEHMTRAAKRLRMQQPPLSQQIQLLEAELGLKLFERTSRSIRLNSLGKVFLEDARHILALAEEAKVRVKKIAWGEEGAIKVGYTNSSSIHRLAPQIIHAFRSRYPRITLNLQENTSHDLLLALENHEVDVAFVRASVTRFLHLKSFCLHNEPMVVALPKGHRLAQKNASPLALAELKIEDFVLCRRADGPVMQDALLAECYKAGFNPHVVEEVPRLISAITLIAAGRGISIVPETLKSIHADSVIYKELDKKSGFTVPLNLAYRASGVDEASEGAETSGAEHQDKAVAQFIELAKSFKIS